MSYKIKIFGTAFVAAIVGIAIGFFGRDHIRLQSHSECIDQARTEIALKDLERMNSFLASFNAKKACDQRYEERLNFEDDADLEKAILISSSLRFGENGVHELIIDNNTTNFIVTRVEIEIEFTDGSYEGSVIARTDYIRVRPKTTDYEVKIRTNLFDTSNIEDHNFSFSISQIWGVDSSA